MGKRIGCSRDVLVAFGSATLLRNYPQPSCLFRLRFVQHARESVNVKRMESKVRF